MFDLYSDEQKVNLADNDVLQVVPGVESGRCGVSIGVIRGVGFGKSKTSERKRLGKEKTAAPPRTLRCLL